MQSKMRGASSNDELDGVSEDILLSLAEEGPIEAEPNAAAALAKRMTASVSGFSAKIRRLEQSGHVVIIHNGANLMASIYVTADGCRAVGVKSSSANVPANLDALRVELASFGPPPKPRPISERVSVTTWPGPSNRKRLRRTTQPRDKEKEKDPAPASPAVGAGSRPVPTGKINLIEIDFRILRDLAENGSIESSNARLDLIARSSNLAYAESELVGRRLKRLAIGGHVERELQGTRVVWIEITELGRSAVAANP